LTRERAYGTLNETVRSLFYRGFYVSKGDDTRNRILETSVNLFNQHGFAGTSLSDVMQASGLQKGGIYRHFESKDELALETFDHAYDRLRRHYLQALRGIRRAPDRLEAMVSAFGDLAEGAPLLGGCPILNTAIDSDDTHPALLAKARAAMADWMSLFVMILNSGRERGQIRADIDVSNEAAHIIANLEGALVLCRIFDDPVYLELIKASLRQHFQADLLA